MTTDEKKVYRTQIKKTLQALKDPTRVAPTLRSSVEDAIQMEYAKRRAEFDAKFKEFQERMEKREAELERWRREQIKKAKKIGIAPAPKKRKIDLSG